METVETVRIPGRARQWPMTTKSCLAPRPLSVATTASPVCLATSPSHGESDMLESFVQDYANITDRKLLPKTVNLELYHEHVRRALT